MKLLKYIFIFFQLLQISNYIYSQDKQELIEKIKEEIESIHLDTTLKIITLQNNEFLDHMPEGGGELTGFYKGKRICRIYRSIGISHGVGISEFYYKKNKLIFVREKFNSYVYDDSLGSFDYTKLNTTYEGKYYFDKGKMIHSYIKGNRINSTGSEETEIELTGESNEAFKLISYKIKSIPGYEIEDK